MKENGDQVHARIEATEYHLPDGILTNAALATEFPEWTDLKIEGKLGIRTRHVAREDECASDLAVAAAGNLFSSHSIDPAEIDFLLLCTQSPDYFLPSTSCLIQDRLGLRTSCGALDFNLGCSGFVYGLGLASGLVEASLARTVLLLTADTYTKFLDPKDKASRALFGDGAAATLVRAAEDGRRRIGPFVWGTDGRGGGSLIVRGGAARSGLGCRKELPSPDGGADHFLHMDGPSIFVFTLDHVSRTVGELLEGVPCSIDDIDLFVFHQANKYMLDHLRAKIGIPEAKFLCHMAESGNTVSTTIPIVLSEAARTGSLRRGMRVMVVGFGVGLSWAAALIEW